jgi:flagellar biosynthesis chaperone FliJ
MAAPFRLARVLRLREQIRRLRTHEAERLAARLAAVRAEALGVAAERERLGMAEAQQAVAGTLTPDALHLGRSYDGALADAERAYAVDMTRLGHALDAKRIELLRDRQEEEKYVRLAAAHRQRGLEDEARESERSLDELAVDRYRRNQKERKHDQV